MTKLCFVGDLHAKRDNLDLVRQSIEFAWAQKPDAVVLLGDLLDTKEVIHGSCIMNYLNILEKTTIPHFIIPGNHDRFNAQPNADHVLGLLTMAGSHVNVINSPSAIDFDGVSVGFLPYNPPIQLRLDISALKESHPGKLACIVAHADLTGYDYGNGHVCTDGIDGSELSMWLKDWAPLFISGHFHKHQHVNNVCYVGTPFSHSFGETDQTKYISILDTKTGILDHIQTPFRQHVTITTSVENWQSDLANANPECIKRLVITGTPAELSALPKAMPANVKIILSPKTLEATSTSGILETKTREAQFIEWATNSEKLDQETLTLALEILKNVQ